MMKNNLKILQIMVLLRIHNKHKNPKNLSNPNQHKNNQIVQVNLTINKTIKIAII
jgi:hypothetical protein